MLTITEIKKTFHLNRLNKILSYLHINKFPSDNYFKSKAYYAIVLDQYIKGENYINIFSNKIDLSSLKTDINILPRIISGIPQLVRQEGKHSLQNPLGKYFYLLCLAALPAVHNIPLNRD